MLGGDLAHGERLAQGQLVLGQGAGLVRAQHVHAGQLLDGHQPAHDGLLGGQQTGADRHGHRQHRGHGHGDGGHGEDQGELQGGQERVAASDRHDHDHRHQGGRQDDQKGADLQHGPLEVADSLRLLDQLGGLAEVGVGAGGVDQGADLTLSDDRRGEHRLTGLAGGGQRFSGQRGLIHLDRVALQQARIGGHNVAQAQADDVAGYQLTRRRGDPLPVPSHSGLDGQLGLQGVVGLAGLTFFGESDPGVGQEQHQDDEKSAQWPSTADRITAASIIHGIGPQK